MWMVKLADGTTLTRLTLNGNNFISETEIDESIFENNLSYVEITDDDGKTTAYNNMFLVQCRKWTDGNTWFVLAEKTKEMIEKEKLETDLALMNARNQALSERNDFLEDCIAEMATVIYA